MEFLINEYLYTHLLSKINFEMNNKHFIHIRQLLTWVPICSPHQTSYIVVSKLCYIYAERKQTVLCIFMVSYIWSRKHSFYDDIDVYDRVDPFPHYCDIVNPQHILRVITWCWVMSHLWNVIFELLRLFDKIYKLHYSLHKIEHESK